MEKIIDQRENFVFELIIWYKNHQRKLPWRETKDPYKIWLSEIILQQTRVAQGKAYYDKFVSKYPEVGDLAMAAEEEVLKDWQGLGYYSRARNLHHSAKIIQNEFKGEFPNTYKAIKQLKGVGDYTAAAISSFAFDLPHAVVDGNVYRLLSRYFGLEIPIDSTKGKKEFAELAQELIPEDNAAIFNQAIMEFGALQCTPKQVDCEKCPLQTSCFAFVNQAVDRLPVKEKKLKVRNRHLHYFIIESDDEILVNKRSEKGIWQNLYDFPLIELNGTFDWEELKKSEAFLDLIDHEEFKLEGESQVRKHILSHQHLYCKFIHLRMKEIDKDLRQKFSLIQKEDFGQLPVPKLIENYLREETNLLSLFNY